MKLRSWVVGALVAGGIVASTRGCLGGDPPPDARLANQFEAMCKIARSNVETPERGVRAMGRYLDKHVADMFGEWGGTLAAIERIPDDAKHDARARVARDRLHAPLRACARDWGRFGEAVEADPAARALVEHFSERLSRTFEIIAGGTPGLADLPRELEGALDASLAARSTTPPRTPLRR